MFMFGIESTWSKLLYLVMLAAAVVLAGTAYWSVIVLRVPLSGWLLIAHCLAAPVFAVALALLALCWADASRFADPAANRFHFGQKVIFWAILVCAIGVIGSAVAGLSKLLGTDDLHAMVEVHRYSSVVLSGLIVLQFWRLLVGPRRRTVEASPAAPAAQDMFDNDFVLTETRPQQTQK